MSAARAQDASAWDAQPHTAARLIAGCDDQESPTRRFLRAGVEIKLDPGWKTYWRDPGDSGVPPTLDFSGSDNVKSVTVLWPAPERFPDGAGGNSIGYLDHVILPLRIAPQDAAKQSSLQLKLGYDICGNMCVPVESEPQARRSTATAPKRPRSRKRRSACRGASRSAPSQAATTAKVLPFSPCIASPATRMIASSSRSPRPPARRSICSSKGRRPIGRCRCREPKGGTMAPTRQFTFDLDGLPPDAHAQGATLTFTAVSGDDAIEVPAHLD